MSRIRPLTETVDVTKNNVIVRFSADSLKRIHEYDLQRNKDEPSVLIEKTSPSNPNKNTLKFRVK